ncbi:MAG: transglycosylase domain-containing protein [Ruminococcus sp.]|nr:transglycosylase domain-containing protein [Ruminococcus sp.]
MKLKMKKKDKVPRKPKKKINKKNLILTILISLGIIGASAVLAFALYIIISSPDFVPDELYNKESSVLYASDGTTEIARLGSENIELVTYNDLPQVLIDALVATEDSRYFQHNGFDAARFIKASLGQLAGKNAGGASTLSMQLIKNKFKKDEKGNVASSGIAGIVRKFSDIYMSVFKLEAVYTKEEIIEFYLNSQWLSVSGSNYSESITGVEQGSQYFFGKSVSDLTLPEAALLVGIFNNPTYYNPYMYPENAKERQSTVLNLMVRHGYISEEEKEFAEGIPIESLLIVHKKDISSDYQAFIDLVIEQVKAETGDDPAVTPMNIYTTLDMGVQDTLNKLSRGELYKFKDEKIQYGMAITSTQDGSITAISPGRNYVYQSTNRAVGPKVYKNGIKRQPGSTAKIIFDYGPYIEYLHGSTGTIFIDEPWTYSSGGSIKNVDNTFVGPITMRSALVQSRNVPALQAFQQVAKEVGLDKIADFAHGLGIDYGKDLYESMALGGSEFADPLTMSAAYAAFGRGGIYIEPYSFTKIVYLENDEVYNHPIERTRAMSEQTAYLITDMLMTAGRSHVGGNFDISGTDIAAKTGTTNFDSAALKQYKYPASATPDHWDITYSPDYSIALWYGYDINQEGYYTTSNNGAVAKKAIMAAVAPKIYKQNSKFDKPSGITSVSLEKETYPTKLASNYTPSSLKVTEYYKSGYEPSEVSSRFNTLDDPTNGKASYNGYSIELTWDAISTPEAIDTNYIESMFNESYWKFYEQYKSKYYENYIAFNNANLGTIGYQVYLKDPSGNLISLGFTTNNYYTYNGGYGSDYTFVVKSAYSLFKDNMSNGITIKTSNSLDNVWGLD